MTRLLFCLSLMLGLCACEVFDRTEGRITLALTDAPVDGASSVFVSFSGVELTHEDGEVEEQVFEPPLRIDLLDFSEGRSADLLTALPVPAGRYDRIRLQIARSSTGTESSVVLANGNTFPLFVPEDAEDGLTVNGAFRVPQDGDAAFTVDVDLRRSLFEPETGSGAYRLRPALRIVEDAASGDIAGSVATSRVEVNGCVPAVYAYAGRNVEPDDIDGQDAEPLASASVRFDATSARYRYRLALLPAGDYSLAYTCGAGVDQPGTSETLGFVEAAATVRAQATSTLDF